MKARFILFHYIMKDETGKVLHSSYDGEPMMFLEGSSEIMPPLEDGIRKLGVGHKSSITIKAAEAYGPRDEKLRMRVPLEKLPNRETLKIGGKLRWLKKDYQPHVFRILELDETHAILDGNHPLAGHDLTFDVEIKEIRPSLIA